tara:strand:- start:403 stop:522 length:120 start_codon:yes stop_codon:yes gene_type:complete
MIFNTPRDMLTITEPNFLDNGGGLARILPVTPRKKDQKK